MIFHIFNNESDFSELGFQSFSKAKIPSEYAIFGHDVAPRFAINPTKIDYYQLNSSAYQEFLSQLAQKNYQLVVFHGLLNSNLTVAADILKLKIKSLKTGWIIYGSEVSDTMMNVDHFHGPKTSKLYYKLKPIRRILPLVKLFQSLGKRNTKSILRKMDYFIHFMPEEIEWVEQQLGITKPHLFSIYMMLEDYFGPDLYDREVSNTKNILIGNSSSFTSNHVELIDAFQGRLPEDFKVHVPLSYGNQQYGKYIEGYGKEKLGDLFVPMMERMLIQDYNEFLLTCPFLFMNHYRQQGLGNVLTALWMGAKVYLNEDVSTFKYLKRLGFHVFSIEAFFASKTGPLELEMLSPEKIAHNRELMKQNFSRKSVSEKIHASFQAFS